MAPPPIQSRYRKPITYGRISRSNSTNFKGFQDTVKGRNHNEEPRATVPRRIRASGLSPPSLPPMAEQYFPRTEFDSTHHTSDGNNEDPFADPPAPDPQVPTGLACTKEVKQSVWPSLPKKVALAEKSVNHPVLRNTTVATASDAASPSNTGRTSGPPPRPHKIRHYAPSLGGQGLPYLLSPSKARSPISKDNFRRFSTRATEKEAGRPQNTPPVGPGIDQQEMAIGNTGAGARARGKTRYVTKKTTEKMGSSPPCAGYSSHYEGATPTPLKKTFGGGVQKTLSPQYSAERMKKRRKGCEPVPTTASCETGYESGGDLSVKDPFASGQDGDFEHEIFAGESSDYIAEIPKRHRSAREPYDWDTRAQSTQNPFVRAKEMKSSVGKASTKNKSRKLKRDAESEDRNLGKDWDEQGSPIADAAESIMAYIYSDENIPPGPAGQSTSKRQLWGQFRACSKAKSKKPPGKPLPLEKTRNSRSNLLESAGDAAIELTVGSGAEEFTADVAQKTPESIPTTHSACGIKHHGVGNDKFIRNGELDEDVLGSWDDPGSCKPSPNSLPVRVNSQNATYPVASQTGGEIKDFRQDSSIPNAGVSNDTRSSTSLGTRRARGKGQGENGKPVTRFEDFAFQGPTRAPGNSSANSGNRLISSYSRGAIPPREKSPKGIPHNTKRKKGVKKTKTIKPQMKMICEDDDVDELQMDLPGMRI